MICATCGGGVIWMGPFSNLTHTECQSCGRVNNQVVESVDDCADDSADSEATNEKQCAKNEHCSGSAA